MNQVQDVTTVFVPRLKLTVTLVSVQQAITQSIKELRYDQPIDDQAEALQATVSVLINAPQTLSLRTNTGDLAPTAEKCYLLIYTE